MSMDLSTVKSEVSRAQILLCAPSKKDRHSVSVFLGSYGSMADLLNVHDLNYPEIQRQTTAAVIKLFLIAAALMLVQAGVISIQSTVAHSNNMQPIFFCQFSEDNRIDFNDFHILAASQKSHILKAFEQI